MNHSLRFVPLAVALTALPSMTSAIPSALTPASIVSTATEPVAAGPFRPEWKSLGAYSAPEWFRDAKFGIWAHWGPQCQPEAGDWYARHLYSQDHQDYQKHLARYGHPSEAGFKEVIHDWKAGKWEPEKLVALYKRVGTRYFFAMANHHDNLDLWAPPDLTGASKSAAGISMVQKPKARQKWREHPAPVFSEGIWKLPLLCYGFGLTLVPGDLRRFRLGTQRPSPSGMRTSAAAGLGGMAKAVGSAGKSGL